ncbi:VanZ family protein [Aeromicrobium massiliense]|uniref:VanZ family protein n=1 Tax=Aeromicrobium massiliense TaxID=1464554 RepID=UPI000675E968|nr:VanZ family protein [Aeromicrobium massiliense]
MDDAWTWPAWIGVVLGSGAFLALLVPILVVQVRRYGRLSLLRLLGSAALVVYLLTLAAYTLLPLPSGDLTQWCAEHAVGAELVPLHSLADVREQTAGLGPRATLTSTVVLQVVLNVALFVPWGVLARRFAGLSLLRATASGFLLSLLIETTQYTGWFGLVGCSYRVGDVDDVLTNTAGTLVGAALAPLLLGWMPDARALRRERDLARPVTTWRRWSGMVVDLAAYSFLGGVLVVLYRLARLAAGRDVPLETGWPEWTATAVLPALVVALLPALSRSGASLGQRAMWLAPSWDGPPRPSRRVRRVLGTSGTLAVLHAAATAPGVPMATGEALTALTQLALLVAFVAVPCTRDRRGLSGLAAGVVYRDVRAGG